MNYDYEVRIGGLVLSKCNTLNDASVYKEEYGGSFSVWEYDEIGLISRILTFNKSDKLISEFIPNRNN